MPAPSVCPSCAINLLRALAGITLACCAGAALAQAPRPLIYSCVARGVPIQSDRPIANCDGEQRIMNPDGTPYRVMPPPQTEEERAAEDAKLQQESAADNARAVEARRDRNLLSRYPNESRYNALRKEAIDSLQASIHEAEARIAQLEDDRKRRAGDAALYAGKKLPDKLKTAIDSSNAALTTEKAVLQDRQADLVRAEKAYDDDLARLKKIWPAR
jgi:hypothetical protein